MNKVLSVHRDGDYLIITTRVRLVDDREKIYNVVDDGVPHTDLAENLIHLIRKRGSTATDKSIRKQIVDSACAGNLYKGLQFIEVPQ